MDSAARRTIVGNPRTDQSMTLTITVEDHETLNEIEKFPIGPERDSFVVDALRIGVLALRQARGQIDAETVKQEGEKILSALAHKLDSHQANVQERLTISLKEYFDPESGRLQERLARLLKKDGELEVILRKQIGGQDSELTRTLSTFVGQESLLMKQLDPKQTDGLIATLRSIIDAQLIQQRDRILEQFSLDHKDGALSRFVMELEQRQGKLSGDLHQKIDLAVKEFSLNDDNSALSRLVRNVREAQQTISSEFSLDQETSALSRLKGMMEETQRTIHGQLSLDEDSSALSRLKKELLGLLKTQQEESTRFHTEVKTVLETMKARKEEMQRSTRHGVAFEDAVCEFIEREAMKSSDIARRCGTENGRLRKKVGDMTIELGPECIAPGAMIVIEVKDEIGYRFKDACEEIQVARENRSAQIGLFVFAKSNAPSDLDPVYRLGQDVYVVWDSEDIQTDIYLKTGITLAKALCVRNREESVEQQRERIDMEQSIIEIQKTTLQLDKITTWSTTIRNNGENILGEAAKIKKTLELQTELLKERVSHL
jgi:hypothetical protein